MTDEEVLAHLKKHAWASGIKVIDLKREYGTEHQLIYEDVEASCIDVPLQGAFRDAYMARSLAMLGTNGEEGLFYGATLWITLSSIGSPQLERTGWMQIELMRRGFGELRPLESARGHWFRNGEVVELAAFLAVCLEFRWDAWLVPAGDRFFVKISHDEFVAVATRDQETFDGCMAALNGLNPEVREGLIEEFCPNSRHIQKTAG